MAEVAPPDLEDLLDNLDFDCVLDLTYRGECPPCGWPRKPTSSTRIFRRNRLNARQQFGTLVRALLRP
jgi:hypothetical protein